MLTLQACDTFFSAITFSCLLNVSIIITFRNLSLAMGYVGDMSLMIPLNLSTTPPFTAYTYIMNMLIATLLMIYFVVN